MNPQDYKPRVGLWTQRDWRWNWKQLGKSQAYMGPKGCAVTCLAFIILRDYWDINKKNPDKVWRPGDVCDWATAHKKFTPSGSVYLNTVDELSKGHCINVYSPEKAHYVMVQLKWGGLDHWVVKLGTEADDLCFDPWVGQIVRLHQPKWYVTTGRRWFKVTSDK